jgi:hypothetical protein
MRIQVNFHDRCAQWSKFRILRHGNKLRFRDFQRRPDLCVRRFAGNFLQTQNVMFRLAIGAGFECQYRDVIGAQREKAGAVRCGSHRARKAIRDPRFQELVRRVRLP